MSIALPPDANTSGADDAVDDQNGNLEEATVMSDNAYNNALEVKEQDRWLPIANVARIMKTALPENAKIAKEAKEAMQECVSEFISFITSEASDKCHCEKRKTVNGEDVLFAMTSLGFENYSETLKIYLARYRLSNAAKSDPKTTEGAAGTDAAANVAAEDPPTDALNTTDPAVLAENLPTTADAEGGVNVAEGNFIPSGLVPPAGDEFEGMLRG